MIREFPLRTDINELQREALDFAALRFPNQSLEGVIKHLKREADEILNKPYDRTEQADVLLLLLQVAARTGTSAEVLINAAFEKLEINRLRQWPETPDADGVFHHIEAHIERLTPKAIV